MLMLVAYEEAGVTCGPAELVQELVADCLDRVAVSAVAPRAVCLQDLPVDDGLLVSTAPRLLAHPLVEKAVGRFLQVRLLLHEQVALTECRELPRAPALGISHQHVQHA